MATRTAVGFDHPSDYRDEISAPSGHVRLLVVPERRYLMIDGDADPGSGGFQDAIASLYPVAYGLHFLLKRRGVEAPVGVLEGLFWVGGPGPLSAEQFETAPGQLTAWRWRLLLPLPDAATEEEIASVVEDVRLKKRPRLIDQVRWETWDEGRVAQITHIGPYDAEAPTIERLNRAIAALGLERRGCHHEIYIGDPRRSGPERLKTIIRQAVV